MVDRGKIVVLIALLALLAAQANGKGKSNGNGNNNGKEHEKVVAYDSRSMIINGSRELLFSGSIHYPRSTVEMWPDLIKQAKEGGLTLIQTYVSGIIHEPCSRTVQF